MLTGWFIAGFVALRLLMVAFVVLLAALAREPPAGAAPAGHLLCEGCGREPWEGSGAALARNPAGFRNSADSLI